MFKFFRRLIDGRRLRRDGLIVESNFVLYINNEAPIICGTKESAKETIENYRKQNDIFNLQIFRNDTYVL